MNAIAVFRPNARTPECPNAAFAIVLALALVIVEPARASVIYVKTAGSGGSDSNGGTAWNDAYATVQKALSESNSTRNQIWVAVGTYYPDEGPGQTNNANGSTFRLRNHIAVYGGFAGTESNLNDRDWNAHETILSGDLDQSGTYNSNDAYHVVTSDASVSNDTILDGFTIKKGYAASTGLDGGGAGFMSAGDSIQVKILHCTFRENHTAGGSGAVYLHTAQVTFEDCVFLDNRGGASVGAYPWGGAVYCSLSADTTFRRCRFLGNHADSNGGAVACAENTTLFINCVFCGNATEGVGGVGGVGGAVYLYAGAWSPDTNTTFTNCAFTENKANSGGSASGGGAIYCQAGAESGQTSSQPLSLTVRNTIVWDNVAAPTGSSPYNDPNQIAEDENDGDPYADEITISVQYSDIEIGYTGMGNFNAPPGFRDADGADDDFGTPDDDLRLNKASVCLDAGDPDGSYDSTDLDGADRVQDTICDRAGGGETAQIDLGPYEFQRYGLIYVDKDATGGDNDGTSWSDAYTSLQTALSAAAGDPEFCEIWVAEGTYKPSSCTNCGSGDRTSTFTIPNNVGVYGGFAGSETTRGLRNPATHVTTLDGLLTGISGTYRTYHVVTMGDDASEATVLDGFTVRNGRADGSGSNKEYGGGILITGKPTIGNCILDSNRAKDGGAVYILNGGPTFVDCVFTDNDADNGSGGGKGAGVYATASGATTKPSFLRCNFNNNKSLDDGGAVYVHADAAGANFTNCLFYQNEADKNDSGAQGGAIYTNDELGLYNCTFARNQCGAADGGAGLYHAAGSSIIKDCIFWLNATDAGSTPDAEADQIKVGGGSISVTYTCIQNIDSLDGLTNTGLNPLFDNAASDDYDLDDANCGFQTCDSSGIDQGNDDNCSGECDSGGDVKKRTRKVNLDNRTYRIDKGALETPSS